MGGRLRLRVYPRAEVTIRAGHPWVYAASVKGQNRRGRTGELAVIYDRRDRFLAVGMYEEDSPIRVRVLAQGKAVAIGKELWKERAEACLELRRTLMAEETDGMRLIHGESEGFPGLVVDGYSDVLVVKVYAGGWLTKWREVEEVFREVFSPRYLVMRTSRNLAAMAEELGMKEGYVGEAGPEVVVFRESGLWFEADVVKGQKTGFFLDQRENRKLVGEMAMGRDVLNVFSFTGGFSVYAARGGARSVTDVDISGYALRGAERNFRLNAEGGGVEYEGIQEDAFRWMDGNPGRYDLIVVDPPSLAKKEGEREGALRAYERLNRNAVGMLRAGGVLVAASCSAHVGREEFYELVGEVMRGSGREWEELWRSGHALDHPAGFKEAEYLKAMCVRVR